MAPTGRSLSLPATAVAALVAAVAVLAAQLPWYAPLPLLGVAPATCLARAANVRWRAFFAFALAMVPAVLAAGLAWFRPV